MIPPRFLPPIVITVLSSALYLAQACPHGGITTEALIPFLNNPNSDFNFDTVPEVNVWFSRTVSGVEGEISRSYEFPVDTGSCGILMDRPSLKDVTDAEMATGRPGFQFLTSSKLLYTGTWIQRNVYFNYETGDDVKAVLEILVVSAKTHCPDYELGVDGASCPHTTRKELKLDNIRVMGIGFGRTGDGQPQGTPDKNPILNVQEIRHASITTMSFWPGWIISPAGLTVGLTEHNYDDPGYQQHAVKLPGPSGGSGGSPPTLPYHYQWGEVKGSVSVVQNPAVSPPKTFPVIECSVLLDTGVDQAYIRVPKNTKYNTHPEAGTGNGIMDTDERVSIVFGPPTSTTETFTVDDMTNKVTPRITYSYEDDSRHPFVNTGRHAFRSWNAAYDPVCGEISFLPH